MSASLLLVVDPTAEGSHGGHPSRGYGNGDHRGAAASGWLRVFFDLDHDGIVDGGTHRSKDRSNLRFEGILASGHGGLSEAALRRAGFRLRDNRELGDDNDASGGDFEGRTQRCGCKAGQLGQL